MKNNKEAKKKILKEYVKIADFIAKINGPNCEVLVHDISDLKKSIIYIVNGHVTNRKTGGGITDYALSVILEHDYRENDYVTNYVGKGANGKITRSSTYYIKGDDGELIGLLCINYDITGLLNIKGELENLLIVNDRNVLEQAPSENFDISLDDVVNEIIAKGVMNSDDRIALNDIRNRKNPIRIMYDLGLFRVKGSVAKVANLYNVSIQTVYRYIKDIERLYKKKGDKDGYQEINE